MHPSAQFTPEARPGNAGAMGEISPPQLLAEVHSIEGFSSAQASRDQWQTPCSRQSGKRRNPDFRSLRGDSRHRLLCIGLRGCRHRVRTRPLPPQHAKPHSGCRPGAPGCLSAMAWSRHWAGALPGCRKPCGSCSQLDWHPRNCCTCNLGPGKEFLSRARLRPQPPGPDDPDGDAGRYTFHPPLTASPPISAASVKVRPSPSESSPS
jgi:hypothetical protein